ncbi:MAG TPA: universal stress protein [archaeon]|nr:universal stress protein [archaeon]
MRIVLGTDGSEGARWAGEVLLALPFPPPVDVTVVSAVDVPEPAFTSLTPMARRAYGQAMATMRREAEEVALKAIETSAEALDGRVASLATRLKQGSPATALIEMAEGLRANLIAVGSRGLGPVKEFLLGSVSHKIVRCAPCSVLIARSSVERLQRVLLGVDGSVHADAAAKFVADLFLPREVSIHLCTVAEEPIFGPAKAGRTPEELHAALRTISEIGKTAAEHVLDEARALLATEGHSVTASLRSGHPVDHLLAAIREFRPDLAVIGAKGRTTAKGSGLGSVAHMVLKYASCSVLVVRP